MKSCFLGSSEGFWNSATDGYFAMISNDPKYTTDFWVYDKTDFLSIRCIKD